MIGMSLLKVEQETIILFNEAEATASVYTITLPYSGYFWNCARPIRPRYGRPKITATAG